MLKRAVFAIFSLGLTLPAVCQTARLTSLNAVHRLTNEQAAAHLTAEFDATVTYYRDYENTLFVQDGDAAIYVQPAAHQHLQPGDRIHLRGTTSPSFRPFIGNAAITLLSHGKLPPAPLADVSDLI